MTQETNGYKKISPDEKTQMRDSYVTGYLEDSGQRRFLSLEEIAVRFDHSVHTIRKLASKEGWKQQKDKFEHTLQQELDEKRLKQFAEESKKFDVECVSIAKSVLQRIKVKLGDSSRSEDFTPQQLDQIGGAALKIQKFAKLAMGETTDHIQINSDINEHDSFRRAMELLDQLEGSKRESGSSVTH
tara:strand:+ start:967 stop:1524 length:558 start_codon:yes stop_codon:yes gene_type:complete